MIGLPKVAVVLILAGCWGALAFSSKQIHSKTHPQSTPCYLFGRRFENFEFTKRKRDPFVLASDTLSLTSDGRRSNLFRPFRRLLSFPLRLFFFGPLRPLRWLLQFGFLNDLDTVTAATEASTSETSQSAYSEAISELDNAVSIPSPVEENVVTTLDVVSTDAAPSITVNNKTTKAAKKVVAGAKPAGDRWAIAQGTDLSGNWEVIVSEDFKKKYDSYLERFGQPLLVRTVAINIIDRTKEKIEMTEDGKCLFISGKNARGVWDRSLVASGTEIGNDQFSPLHVPIVTADSEKVEAESWWESEGTVHVSWLRGVSRYHGGGAFESRRYLDGDTYICESTFHFNDENREPNRLVWRFRKIPDSN